MEDGTGVSLDEFREKMLALHARRQAKHDIEVRDEHRRDANVFVTYAAERKFTPSYKKHNRKRGK